MKRLLLLVLIAAVVAALLPTSASATYWTDCGRPGPLRSHNLGCGKARRVANGYMRAMEQFNTDPHPKHFSCDRTGLHVFRVSCRRLRGDRLEKVRFAFSWG